MAYFAAGFMVGAWAAAFAFGWFFFHVGDLALEGWRWVTRFDE